MAVGYIRVSTDRQSQSGLGLESQEEQIRGWCRDRGVPLTDVFRDTISGSTLPAERVGLMSALATKEDIVVARIDRLARTPLILLTLEERVSRAGLRIWSVAGEGTEGDDPASVLLRRVIQAVAEHERALTRSRTKLALAQKRARGERLGRPPYGFSVSGGELVPTDRISAVKRVLELRKLGKTIRDITYIMEKEEPEHRWNTDRVFQIIKRWKGNQDIINL